MSKNTTYQEYKSAVGAYLRQISQMRRLSKEEELELWISLEKLKEKKTLLKEEKAESHLIEQIDEEIVSIHNKLVKSNLRLVMSIAKRYYSSGVPFIDIIDEGNVGLIEAVKKFDYKKGFKFSTYGVWWIKQSIVKAVSSKKHIIRFPMHIARLIKKSIQTTKNITQKLGREPTIEEIANDMNIDYKTLSHILLFSQNTASIDLSFRDSENSDVAYCIEDKNQPIPQQKIFVESLRNTIDEALKSLDEKERKIVIYRFGLYGQESKTLEETGKELNITRERVRQIQIKAIKKMSKLGVSKELKNFLWDN